MKTSEIRQKLHNYIELAQDKKVKAIYTIVEAEIEYGKHWEDKDFITEMNKRVNDLEKEKIKGYTWNEVKTRAKKALKVTKSH